MISQNQVKALLENSKLIEKKKLEKVLREATEKRENAIDVILAQNLVGERPLFEAIAESLKLPFTDLHDTTIRRDILALIPEPMVQFHRIVAFARTDRNVKVATVDPDDLQTVEFLEKKIGLPIELHLTTPSSISEALKQYHHGLKAEFKAISQEQAPSDRPEALKQLAEDIPIVRVVDTLLEYAVFEGASDIHIEPTEKETLVRYRVDGVLRDVMTLPKHVQPGLVARIKILSSLKIDEHRLPQDGRFKIESGDQRVAFRVSILPVVDGEKVVLRLLNETARVLTLEQIGLQPRPLELVKIAIKKPHGITYVTGPTGSGKTTTLYTILSVLNTPKVNISTIEDPVEYRIPRVNQTQVNPRIGLTFANGLRTLLRQDPNIIMVGEIRDPETAEIATHAALTGHLVLSTLHTNDAVTALPRLTEMGVPTFLVSSTTNVVMAQRLVRKICTHCIESYTLTKKQIADLEKQVDFSSVLKGLVAGGAATEKQGADELLFFRGRGCPQCNEEGYRGRIGIYEVLDFTPAIAKLVLERATSDIISQAAKAQGMLTMLQDGFLKAKAGVTAIEEVLRVTKE
ncbi:MAG: type II/IV secretion system protein [Candidatus Kerfeldbacteria bacterium]|nr:type II/IV secretion system protein [Candidatus Kerfeldbacteria bacterium]